MYLYVYITPECASQPLLPLLCCLPRLLLNTPAPLHHHHSLGATGVPLVIRLSAPVRHLVRVEAVLGEVELLYLVHHVLHDRFLTNVERQHLRVLADALQPAVLVDRLQRLQELVCQRR